jgi:DNA-binding NarL/FixJ family response regulator
MQNRNSTPKLKPKPNDSSPTVSIWLVDDDRRLRDALKQILEQFAGIRCTAGFQSPNAVLSALASKPGPDVILLDIQMGGACGLDAIRPIKALARSTQVLMLTTCFDGELKKRALTDGASGYLLKRYPIEQILDSIHQALKHPAPHLKCSRRQNRMATRENKSHRPNRAQWLKTCLERIPFRLN